MVQLATRPDRSSTTELAQELHHLVDLVETSSRGSAALKADLRLGKSTSKAASPTRPHGSNAPLLLDLLVDRRLGSSVVEDIAAIASTAAVETVAPHHGSSPEVMIEARTTMAATAAATVDTVATEEVEEEVTDTADKVHHLEARLRGCSRNHTQAMAPQAWTTTVLRRHLHHRLVASHLHRHQATCRRHLRHHRSRGCRSRVRISLRKSLTCMKNVRPEDQVKSMF